MSASTTARHPVAAAGALAAASLCEAFHITAASRAEEIAIRTPGDRTTVTWGEYAERVRHIAEGMHALGVRRGDTVALLLTKMPEFHLVDTAAMHLGAVPFSIYDVYAPEQIGAQIADSGARIAVTDTRLAATLAGAGVERALDHVVVVDGGDGLTLPELEQLRSPGFDGEAAWRAVGPDDLATLIYTSGTTGAPKAIELTHGALLRGWRGLQTAWQLEPGGRVISYGSSAHISDRCSTHYGSMVLGFTVTCAAGAPAAVSALAEVRPSLLFAVPPTWAAVRAAVESLVVDERDAFDQALEVAGRALAIEQRGADVPADLRAAWARVEADVLAPVREAAGLASTLGLVGGAPCPADLIMFFRALGVRFGEMYGMSEVVSHIAFDPRDPLRTGTVGRPLPGVEVRIHTTVPGAVGEILVRCDSMMRGYRNRPDATAEALDADGWLHTGDLGALDAEGYLRLTGRKKEIIINTAGHNMSPAAIETTLQAETPLVAHACVLGDGRPYNVALLTLAPGTIDDAATRREIADAVTRANARLAEPERIVCHAVLVDVWRPGGAELTPTMKVRRHAVSTRYRDLVDTLYTPPGAVEDASSLTLQRDDQRRAGQVGFEPTT